MNYKAVVLLLITSFVLIPCKPAKAIFSFYDPGLAIELTALDAAADILLSMYEEAIEEFTNVFTDETIELKITDATAKAEISGQTGAIYSSLKSHAMARMIPANTDYWSPLAQSDFACTSECMRRSILLGYRAPSETANHISQAATDFNQQFLSSQDMMDTISVPYQDASNSGLADARRILPTGKFAPSATDVTQQIIALSNPVPAIDRSIYGNETEAKRQYETVRTIKNMALSVVQRVLAHQGGDVSPAYSVGSSDPWFGQLQTSMRGSIGDIDTNEKISADGALDMQVKSRYANANWLVDIHRKTPTGGLRTLVAMNAVQLELRRQLYIANQDIVLMQSVLSALETDSLYRNQIEHFHNEMIAQ